MKNYNKDGQKLPLFGIGPYMIFGMGLVSVIGIILFGYVFKIGILESPWIIVISVIPAIFMMIGIAELVSERFAHLDRRLPKVRLLRGFGALVLGGILGMAVSMLGLVYGYWIGERNLITMWCMLLGSFLCFIFAELIYKTYR